MVYNIKLFMFNKKVIMLIIGVITAILILILDLI